MLDGASSPTANCRTRYRWLFAGFLLLLTTFRIIYLGWLCPFDLAQDEAHYWDWSRNFDWSYYSKGPLIAWLIRASMEVFGQFSVQLTGSEVLALRMPAVLGGSLLLVALYTLTVQTFHSDRLAFGVVMLTSTMPIFSAVSLIMTIDSPYVCCWAWTLVAGHRAATRNETWAWVATGLLLGIGILAKYSMTLWLFSFCLFLRFSPDYRDRVYSGRFWLMTCVASLFCAPILIWNSNHDWVSFRHVAGQAGLVRDMGLDAGKPRTSPFFGKTFLDFLGGQCGLLVGWWFVAWIAAMIRFRPTRVGDTNIRYLWWMSAPTILVFGASSFRNPGQVNWPVVAYLSGFVVVTAWLAEAWRSSRAWSRRVVKTNAAVACICCLAVTIIAHDTAMIRPLLLSLGKRLKPNDPYAVRAFDPSCRLRGWKHLGKEIDAIRREVAAQDGREPVLAGGYWNMPGEIGFYCAGHPKVYSFGPFTCERFNQYDIWHPNPVADAHYFAEETFIVVNGHEETLKGYFLQAHIAKDVVYCEDDIPVASWKVWVCRHYIGIDRKYLEWRTGY